MMNKINKGCIVLGVLWNWLSDEAWMKSDTKKKEIILKIFTNNIWRIFDEYSLKSCDNSAISL